MPVVTVKYTLFRRRWMPLVPLVLTSPSAAIQVEGYLDSGAFYSVFDLSLLRPLQLNVRYAKRRFVVVGDGGLIPIYLFKLVVDLAERKFIAEVGFSDRLGIGFNILGRKTVFDQFEEIIFREKKREVSFRF